MSRKHRHKPNRKHKARSVVSSSGDRNACVSYICEQGDRPEQLDRIGAFKLVCGPLEYADVKSIIEGALQSIAEQCNTITDSGATLTLTLFFRNAVVVYSIGDSVGFWIDSTGTGEESTVNIQRIAGMHTFHNPTEVERLNNSRVVITKDPSGEKRMGGLNMTGSLGDADIVGLSRDFHQYENTAIDLYTHPLLITASDGMKLDNDDWVAEQVKQYGSHHRRLFTKLQEQKNSSKASRDNASLFIQRLQSFKLPLDEAYCTFIADGHRNSAVVDRISNNLEMQIKNSLGEKLKECHLRNVGQALINHNILPEIKHTVFNAYRNAVSLVSPSDFQYEASEVRFTAILDFMKKLSDIKFTKKARNSQLERSLSECYKWAVIINPLPSYLSDNHESAKYINEYQEVKKTLEQFFNIIVSELIYRYISIASKYKHDMGFKNPMLKDSFANTLHTLSPDLAEFFLQRSNTTSAGNQLKLIRRFIHEIDSLSADSTLSIDYINKLIKFKKSSVDSRFNEYPSIQRIIQSCESWLLSNIEAIDDIAKLKSLLIETKRINSKLDTGKISRHFRRRIYLRILSQSIALVNNLTEQTRYPERLIDQNELNITILALHNQIIQELQSSHNDKTIRARIYGFNNLLTHYHSRFSSFNEIFRRHQEAAYTCTKHVVDTADLYQLCDIIEGVGENPVLYQPLRSILLNTLRYELEISILLYCQALMIPEKQKFQMLDVFKRYYASVIKNNYMKREIYDFVELCIKLPYLFKPLSHHECPISEKASIIYKNCYSSPFYFYKAEVPSTTTYSYKRIAVLGTGILTLALLIEAYCVKWFMLMNVLTNSHGFFAAYFSLTIASCVPILPIIAVAAAIITAMYFGIERIASEYHCEYLLLLKLISTSAYDVSQTQDNSIHQNQTQIHSQGLPSLSFT